MELLSDPKQELNFISSRLQTFFFRRSSIFAFSSGRGEELGRGKLGWD